MEEIEVPVEKFQEEIHERAHEDQEHHSAHAGFSSKVALTSAILAVMAAIAALLAGHHSNEAMIEQIRASDQWSYYQAKGIKSAILTSRADLLHALGKSVDDKTADKVAAYEEEQEKIREQAKEHESDSAFHLRVHQVLGRSVTLFQIAITISAIAVLTRKKKFWWLSLGFGAIGILFFIQGLLIK